MGDLAHVKNKMRNEMPETWRKALPDFYDMKKLLDSASNESY